jgi:hypothetical protein
MPERTRCKDCGRFYAVPDIDPGRCARCLEIGEAYLAAEVHEYREQLMEAEVAREVRAIGADALDAGRGDADDA